MKTKKIKANKIKTKYIGKEFKFDQEIMELFSIRKKEKDELHMDEKDDDIYLFFCSTDENIVQNYGHNIQLINSNSNEELHQIIN